MTRLIAIILLLTGVGLGLKAKEVGYTSQIDNPNIEGRGLGMRMVAGNDDEALVINELQSCNVDQHLDPSLNYGGWMELYNPSAKAIALASLYVSDDKHNLPKFQLPATMGSIKAGGFRCIWFDHNAADGNYSSEADKNVPFKLDAEGGTIYLSDADGQVVASLAYPAGIPRCSWARTTDGGAEWSMTSTPSPEATNAGSSFATERLAAPTVSRDGGVFTGGQTVTFNVDIPSGTTLKYTTDGSTPTLENGLRSATGKFTASVTKLFRFALFQEGYLPSPVVTRSFILTSERRLPIVSIVTDNENLNNEKYGIWTLGDGTNGITGNGTSTNANYNMDWDRPVNVEYFVPEENSEMGCALNQEVGMAICGGWSRSSTPRPFKLKAGKQYELKSYLEYPFFADKPYVKNRTLQFRNNEGSNLQDAGLAAIADRCGLNLDVQAWQPSIVYLNGQKLGYYPIRQPNNKHFALADWGVDTDSIDVFEFHYKRNYIQTAGTTDAYNRWLTLSANAADEDVYREICELVDVDEVINYLCYEFYCGNNDWPWNNLKGYRPHGGKFRMVLMDIGDHLGSTNSPFDNFVNSPYSWFGEQMSFVTIILNMMANEQFRRQFVDTFCLMGGSIFHKDSIQTVLDDMLARFDGYMTPSTSAFSNITSESWKTNMLSRMEQFSQLKVDASKKFKATLSCNLAQAHLHINGLEVPNERFDGSLYAPVTLTALAPAGYAFKGWQAEDATTSTYKGLMTAKGDAWRYYDKGSLDGQDWKAADYDDSGWADGLSPLGYGNTGMVSKVADYNTTLASKLTTYYFRKTIHLDEEPSAMDVFQLTTYVDDGFLLYVNGQQACGYGVSDGATYSTLSTSNVAYAAAVSSFELSPTLFHRGDNVIAVEAHNMSTYSSDIYWAADLTHKQVKAADDCIVSTEPTLTIDQPETISLVALFEAEEQQTPPIRINEVSAAGDIYANDHWKRSDWVELYNTSDEDIDIAGMYLSDKQKKPQRWQVTGVASDGQSTLNTIVPAKGHLIVWCDNLVPLTQLHASFKLDNADGACVSIQAEDGRWADCLTYLEQPARHTYGRYPDGGNYATLLERPTIEKENHASTFDAGNAALLDDDIAITLVLEEGWNWTSHNLAERVDKSRFTTYADILRSSTSELCLDATLGWQGTLRALDPAMGYKLRMREAADITLRGNLYPYATTPVALAQGWNWVGFPLHAATTIEAAMANYQPTEGDLIVGQDAFATYAEGAWQGSLSILTPGQAYLLRAGQSQSFCWNALSANKVRERRYTTPRREISAPWTYDIHAYPNVMPLTAEVQTEDIDLTGTYWVGAFVGEECRGVGELIGDRLYMNIHGEGGETVALRLLSAEGDTYTASQSLCLLPDSPAGTYASPYPIVFSATGVDAVIATSEPARIVSEERFALSGQKLSSSSHQGRPTGLYIVKTRMSDGSTRTRVKN